MACGPCARRRKALIAKQKQKQAQSKPVQAAALGAVLAVTAAAGKVMGIHGKVEDGQDGRRKSSDDSGANGTRAGDEGSGPH